MTSPYGDDTLPASIMALVDSRPNGTDHPIVRVMNSGAGTASWEDAEFDLVPGLEIMVFGASGGQCLITFHPVGDTWAGGVTFATHHDFETVMARPGFVQVSATKDMTFHGPALRGVIK